ncbi:MAG: MurR/RpiR family transcriptional regulator [Phycisphaerales bacterium]|nr:MurR/RpiR family transcriptional regulator [Phycisphaerales bacterium]
MLIRDAIAEKGNTLTPTERRLARLVLEEPTRVAFGTVADLARDAGTSRPSVVRFAAKLGFTGYSDLQESVRLEISRRLSTPGERIRRRDPWGVIRANIERSIADAFESLGEARIAALAAPLVAARRVWVLSGETSMAGAHVLHSGLSMLRPEVHLVFEHSAGRDLCAAGAQDAAVVLDFARYRRVPVTAARALAELGVSILAITDGPLSPLAALTPNWCGLKIPAAGPFDSAVPAVVAAELIVARVADELGDSARERIDQLEALWRRTDAYLEYAPRSERSPGPDRPDHPAA